jgi:hypothetical protein
VFRHKTIPNPFFASRHPLQAPSAIDDMAIEPGERYDNFAPEELELLFVKQQMMLLREAELRLSDPGVQQSVIEFH